MIYDNGEMALGTVKDMKKYILENSDVEEEKDLLEDLSELEEDIIVCVNYDNGMGYTLDWWLPEHKIEIK